MVSEYCRPAVIWYQQDGHGFSRFLCCAASFLWSQGHYIFGCFGD
uniref:Uncharacterized protein n=1 Tax=Setaria italica TaxID=4555 RepID=K3YFP8_SETIT